VRFALFYHSVVSDWNHGNAHFLRGTMRALQSRGHEAVCYEPMDSWSLQHLLAERPHAIAEFETCFPDLRYHRYAAGPDLEARLRSWLGSVDVAIVHEWNEPELVALIGRLCGELGVRSVFHDTHYRVLLEEEYRAQLRLESYELVLAFSPSIAEQYRTLGFENVRVWHEAADVTVFGPRPLPKTDDVVFVRPTTSCSSGTTAMGTEAASSRSTCSGRGWRCRTCATRSTACATQKGCCAG
jgi:spore maturation protein CgeB